MARTVDTAISGPLVLSLADPLASYGSDDPLTITSTGTIATTGSGIAAISGDAGTPWIIVNRGKVSSAAGGAIALAGTATLDNSGAVTGLFGGVDIGGDGAVTNRGSIDGTLGPGVEIGTFGEVTNISGGTITALAPAIVIGGSGVVTNSGSIGSGQGTGLEITRSGWLANGMGGSIEGLSSGVVIGGDGVVANDGTVVGGLGFGVEIGGDGAVSNGADGQIYGMENGVEITGRGTVFNQGAIGSSGGGVVIAGAGFVTNEGVITSAEVSAGVAMTGGGDLTNVGVIAGNFKAFGVTITGGLGIVMNGGTITAAEGGVGAGVELGDGGVVINGTGGSIIASNFGGPFAGVNAGVEITSDSGTVINAGTISGVTDSVLFGPGTANNLLIDAPGAVFDGEADATGTTNSEIELTPGSGSISGIGDGQFTGFSALLVNPGATWTLSGANAIGTVVDDGTLNISGALLVSSAVAPASTGLFDLSGGSNVEIAAALGISSRMSFDAGSELVVDNAGLFGENVGTGHYAGMLLEDFGGATIDIKDFSTSGLSMNYFSQTGLLQLTNSAAQVATLDFQNSTLGSGAFNVDTDGSTGVLITHA